MNERDEPKCALCGLRKDDCICCAEDPTPEELEDAREQRLSRAERMAMQRPSG